MRLNAQEVNTIKKLAIKFFGKDTKVYIFGSRADNKRRGGDIDIYVEVFADDEEKLFDAKTFFIVQLRAVLGEQKIDVVVKNLAASEKLPIFKVARSEGVLL